MELKNKIVLFITKLILQVQQMPLAKLLINNAGVALGRYYLEAVKPEDLDWL